MFAVDRQKCILKTIGCGSVVSVEKLRNTVDASQMTIWRDLKKLENEGLIVRVHGGVLKKDK